MAGAHRGPVTVGLTLDAIARAARIGLNSLRALPGSRRVAQRLGRGPSSGRGKNSGRGCKGQGKWGNAPKPGFEGGQTPFYRRVPKHGFRNITHRVEYDTVNLGKIQQWVDDGRLAAEELITMRTLQRAGLVSKNIKHGVKLLGDGSLFFKTPLNIVVSRASQSAIDAIERAGGRITCQYYGRVGLRALLKPEKFAILPKLPVPAKHKLRVFYSDPKNRGNLERVGPNKFVIRQTDLAPAAPPPPPPSSSSSSA